MKNDEAYLKHIIEAIRDITSYSEGYTFNDFVEDQKTIDAVIRKIEIIGEASKNLSKSTRNKDRSIPWELIVGMRNKLVHEYFGVDSNQVWDTIKHDLPDLQKKISKL